MLFPHTNLSALGGSTAQTEASNKELLFVHCLDIHTHKILNGCYFHYTYFSIIFFHSNMGCLLRASQLTSGDNAAELLLSAAALEDRQGKQFLRCLPPMCQRLSPVFAVCGRQANKQTRSYTVSGLGKGKILLFAECCAATPLHVCVFCMENLFSKL